MATGKVEVTEESVTVAEGNAPNVTIEVTEQTAVISEGVVGLPGASGDKHYQHDQEVPAATWTITHNLGKRPSVTVVDSGGNEWQTAVEHLSVNQCRVTFSAPFAGRAYLN
jgi:hypothetical protein